MLTTVLNDAKAVSQLSDGTISVDPGKVEQLRPVDGVYSADDLVMARGIASELTKPWKPRVARARASVDDASLMSESPYYTYVVITDNHFADFIGADQTFSAEKVQFPESRNVTVSWTSGWSVSATATSPGTIYSCSFGYGGTYSQSETFSVTATRCCTRAFGVKYVDDIQKYSHSWDSYYHWMDPDIYGKWYVAYDGRYYDSGHNHSPQVHGSSWEPACVSYWCGPLANPDKCVDSCVHPCEYRP